MAQAIRAKIGFVTPTSPTTPHFGSFLPLIPSDVQLDFEGMGLMRSSINDLNDTAGMVLEMTTKAVKKRGQVRR